MPRDNADTLLTVAQAATLLGVHPNTIRSWTDGGRLTAYRINARGDRRFRRGDVVRLLVETGGEPAESGELAIFGRMAVGLATAPTPSSVARAAIEAMRTEIGVERVAIYLAGSETGELIAHAGFTAPPPPNRRIPETETWTDGREVATRLATRRGPVGLLVIDAESAARLSPAFNHSLAASLGTLLASATLLGRARREIRRSRALRSVLKELTGVLDLTSVLADIVDLTRSLFDADKAGLWLVHPGEHPYAIAAHHGLDDGFLRRIAALRAGDDDHDPARSRGRGAFISAQGTVEPDGDVLHELGALDGMRTTCVVPLIGGDRMVGVLGLYHRRERTWPEEEITLVQAFADQAAVAIQNARLYRSVADQAARMRSIQDLSARLNRLTDVQAIADAIVAEAQQLAEFHDIRVYRVDWETRMCEPIAFTRRMLAADFEDPASLLRVAVGQGFTGWVAEHGEALLINDALEDERGKTIDGTEDVPESMLVVPMLYEGHALGVIVLSQLGFNRFSADDLQTMSIFAGYAAQAMANATTYAKLMAQSSELERRSDSQRRLLEINERLLATLDPGSVLETIADGLRDVVAYDNLSIYRADHQLQVMQPVLTRERHADEVSRYVIPFGRGLMGWAIEHTQPILANEALTDPRALQIPGTPADPEAVVVVPLLAGGEVLGAMNLSRVGGQEVYFTDNDFELIQLFAAQASIALRNADAHHAISQLADTDALTGLGNHGAFQRDLAQRIAAAETTRRPIDRRFSLLMMDLDRFKTYNDRYGHPAGDNLLHRVATAIYGATRGDDRVYRYGGDEFVLVLPGTTSGQAARVGDRVRRAVAALTEAEAASVTITIGVASHPGDATDRAGLIAAADVALYYGKRSGANTVVRADRLTPDVGGLRGTLEELASAALRDDDRHAVEHLVEQATQIAAPYHVQHESVRDALLTVARTLDSEPGVGRGHLQRAGRLAATLAARLSVSADEQRCIELAARLASLDEGAIAELAPVPSLGNVAAVVAGYHKLVQSGTRRAQRAARPRGLVGAHIVGVASAYDELVTGIGRARVTRGEALDLLRRDPATYRADVLDALAETVSVRPPTAHRRRRADGGSEKELGAA